MEPFRNEPLVDFTRPGAHERFEAEVEALRRRPPEHLPLVVGGRRVTTSESLVSLNPSHPSETVATVARAGIAEAEAALDAAERALPAWSHLPATARAAVLLRAAGIMRRERTRLSALECVEVGKPRGEADADVAEAIDFLEFYARAVIPLSGPQEVHSAPQELNELRHLPLGVGLILPPWNFPLAILTGMASAAIVTGNTVLLKPSSVTPAIGWRYVEIMEAAGLPPGVLNFVPGSGSEIGAHLVQSPRVRFISFTGSRDVGLKINERAARTPPGQRWIKRVVAEMGGKDAIVVLEDADLTAAAEAIVVSAFGFSGQKCSACSRAIVVEAVYDRLVPELVRRTLNLVIGPAEARSTDVGPVSDAAAMEKILGYIDLGKGEGRLLCGGRRLDGEGYLVEPTIFADVEPRARIAQEEIFGPVLAVLRARDLDEALEIANDTVYGLTGAVFGRSRPALEHARERFHVGNLYINRKCTGALVGAHPFGGFNLSGTDAKAGGADYLRAFVQAQSIAERV